MRVERERLWWSAAVVSTMMMFGGGCADAGGGAAEIVAEDVSFGTVESGDDPETSAADQDDSPQPSDVVDADTESTASASDGDTISIEQWRAEMDAACRAAEEDMAVRITNGDFSAEAAVKDFNAQIDVIRELPRPEGAEQSVEQLIEVMKEAARQMESELEDGVTMFELSMPTSETELGARMDALADELGMAECGEGPAEGELSGSDLCDLVPDDMVQAVLGVAPAPEFNDQLTAEGCTWVEDEARFAVQTGSAKVYSVALDFARENGEPISGLGDEALITPGYSSVTGGGTRGTTVWIVSGDTVVAVGAMVDDTDIEADQLRPVAELVLSNVAAG